MKALKILNRPPYRQQFAGDNARDSSLPIPKTSRLRKNTKMPVAAWKSGPSGPA
jgi:hypothetical protein